MNTKNYANIEYTRKEDIPKDYDAFWYVDLKDLLEEDDDFVVLEEIFVDPLLRDKGIGTHIMNNFILDNRDSIMLVHAGALMKEYPNEPTKEDYNFILDRLSKFFTKLGFENINKYTQTYEYKDLYVYTRNAVGNEFYNKVRKYYLCDILPKTSAFIDSIKRQVEDLNKRVRVKIIDHNKLPHIPYDVGFYVTGVLDDRMITKTNIITNGITSNASNILTMKEMLDILEGLNPDKPVRFEVYDNTTDRSEGITYSEAYFDQEEVILDERENEIEIVVYRKI